MTTTAPGERTTERICDGLAIAALVTVVGIAALTFRDYGLGWDDYTHAEYGGLLLHLLQSGFRDQRALGFVNLYAYGGGFDLLAAALSNVLPFDLWETRRLAGALLGVVGLAATWRIGRRLGGPVAGLIALLLLATCPLYYGHMPINPKDGPFAVAMVIFLLGLVRLFQDYPKPSAATLTFAGVGLGLAMGTRILAGLSVVAALIALAFIVFVERRQITPKLSWQSLGMFVLALLPAAVLAYAVMALVWPWGVLDPLNPLRAFLYFTHFFEKPWKEMFGGALIAVPDMPRAYLPQLLALKLPEIFLALSIGGTAGALVTATRKAIAPQQRAALLVVALAALVPIALTVATRPAMYNGIRHFVFVLPPLAVLGGWAGAQMLDWLAHKSRYASATAGAVILIAMLPPVVDMVRLHPYQYTHFNRIAGGVSAANTNYMLDYWGLAFKQAAAEFRAKLAERTDVAGTGRPWRIAVCGPQRVAQIELGPDFVVSWDPAGADWAMTLGTFYCSALNAPVLVDIKRDGVSFARVYDIRGKTISSLLAVPAP
jgi:4-amino-4-deoxy-L-arabinose transferase-like glycosyltransferase